MPMWIVHAPEGAYSTEDKKNLTEVLTQMYVDSVAPASVLCGGSVR